LPKKKKKKKRKNQSKEGEEHSLPKQEKEKEWRTQGLVTRKKREKGSRDLGKREGEKTDRRTCPPKGKKRGKGRASRF